MIAKLSARILNDIESTLPKLAVEFNEHFLKMKNGKVLEKEILKSV